MKKRIPMIFALMLTMVMGAYAQYTSDGRKVKRITFDQEKVNIEYVEGLDDQQVDKAVVTKDSKTTGVKNVVSAKQDVKRRWWTTDGRALPGAPKGKGVYIVTDENGKKKSIKK